MLSNENASVPVILDTVAADAPIRPSRNVDSVVIATFDEIAFGKPLGALRVKQSTGTVLADRAVHHCASTVELRVAMHLGVPSL
jgi:hypothetical protein